MPYLQHALHLIQHVQTGFYFFYQTHTKKMNTENLEKANKKMENIAN